MSFFYVSLTGKWVIQNKYSNSLSQERTNWKISMGFPERGEFPSSPGLWTAKIVNDEDEIKKKNKPASYHWKKNLEVTCAFLDSQF